jgi:hypothetical protein
VASTGRREEQGRWRRPRDDGEDHEAPVPSRRWGGPERRRLTMPRDAVAHGSPTEAAAREVEEASRGGTICGGGRLGMVQGGGVAPEAGKRGPGEEQGLARGGSSVGVYWEHPRREARGPWREGGAGRC